jgi:hypothetical protein
MKSNLIFNSLLVVSLMFVSCKKEEEAVTTTDETPKEIIMPRVQSIPAQNYTQQPTTQNATPGQNQPVTASQTITPNQMPVTTKKGMNPPHGQPGHRCDIAVGAPLNSPPGNNQAKAGSAITQQIDPSKFTTQTQTSQPAATPAILSTDGTATTTTAPGMNPPHGQEGHQCGIAVGAPLPK